MFDDSALSASFTAIHLVMVVLRRHRADVSVLNPFVLPAFLFSATPWLWPSIAGLLAGLASHIAWFMVSERLAPPRQAVPPRSVPRTPAAPASARARVADAIAFVSTPVLAVLEETPDIKTFRLARPDGYDFIAGQFVPIRIRIDGTPHVRCYSISSAPDARGYLEISVRKQGLVSSALHALLRPGVSATIGHPAGRFVYPAGDDRPLALLAGGIGITPVLSMLRHALTSDPMRPVTLLYSARRAHDVAFVSELRTIAERHPQVRIAITLTKPDGPTLWRSGRIDAAMLRQYVSEPSLTIFCLCGPGPMIDELRETLLAIGVPAGQIRSEEFKTAVAASALHAAEPRRGDAPSAARLHQVTFARTGRTVSVPSSTTLLETAEAEGIEILSSCRAGVCQSCRTRVSGGVDCRSDVLDPDDRAAGFVLPCVSWPTEDCTVDA